MNKSKKARIISIVLAMAMALSFTACGDDDTSLPASEVNIVNEDVIESTKSEGVNISTQLSAPETAGTMTTLLEDDTMSGSFLLINYRTTDYFTTNGTLTLNVNASMFSLKNETYQPQETKYKRASVALWKKGEGEAEYVQTAFFEADGKAYSATFTDLDPNAQYRIAFTYSEVVWYRMTGTFTLSGIASAGDVQEDNAQSTASKNGK